MSTQRTCPGCGLTMPTTARIPYDGYFHTSPECWSLFTEVLGEEYGNAMLFGQVHQLTVDAYAVQHAGGPHPDKSVGIHLCGLHLTQDRGIKPPLVPTMFQHLASAVDVWPHFDPPAHRGNLTIWDVAIVESAAEHIEVVERWASQVWQAWSFVRDDISALVEHHLPELRMPSAG